VAASGEDIFWSHQHRVLDPDAAAHNHLHINSGPTSSPLFTYICSQGNVVAFDEGCFPWLVGKGMLLGQNSAIAWTWNYSWVHSRILAMRCAIQHCEGHWEVGKWCISSASAQAHTSFSTIYVGSALLTQTLCVLLNATSQIMWVLPHCLLSHRYSAFTQCIASAPKLSGIFHSYLFLPLWVRKHEALCTLIDFCLLLCYGPWVHLIELRYMIPINSKTWPFPKAITLSDWYNVFLQTCTIFFTKQQKVQWYKLDWI